MKTSPVYLISAFVLLVLQVLYGQTSRYNFKHITVEQGLSQNSVYAIVQDRQGFMWFGTKDGLNRYDGYSFSVFRNRPGDTTSLADNFITTLFVDHTGRLWVGTQNGGLHLFDRRYETFRRVPAFLQSGMGADLSQVNSITEDDSGALWVGTSGGGLVRVRTDKNNTITTTLFKHDPADPASLADNVVNCVYNDTRGTMWVSSGYHVQNFSSQSMDIAFKECAIPGYPKNDPLNVLCFFTDFHHQLWLGSRSGIYCYDRKDERYNFYLMPGQHDPHSDHVARTIAEGNDGSLWIGTFSNMYLFDPATKGYSFAVKKTDPNFSSGIIRIFQDAEGSMWCGTNGRGIFMYNPAVSRFHSITESTTPVPGWEKRSVRSLMIDSEGKVWVGSYDGLYISNSSRTSFRRVFDQGSVPVRGIIEDRKRTVWLASQSGVIHCDLDGTLIQMYKNVPGDSSTISSQTVAAVFEDKQGTIWAITPNVLNRLTSRGTWDRFSFTSRVNDPNDIIPAAIYQDTKGDIWFTSDNGLWRFVPASKRFFNTTSSGKTGEALTYNVTLSLCPDPREPDKYLWIGTAGGGLNRLDVTTGTITAITVANGLPNDVIYGIESDAKGNLWLSTNKGIARFNPVNGNIRTYVNTDGLQGDEYNAGASCKGSDGEILFGGIKGFDSFIPARVHDNIYDPDVVLTGMQLFNTPVGINDATGILAQSIMETKQLELSYDQNVVSFTFASLDYTVPEKNKYRYMLSGFNDRFNESGPNRTATYTNLDPGTYTLRIQGSNSDGIWGTKEATLSIVVLPPFWMTWWFRTVIALAILSIGAAVYAGRISTLTKGKKQQEEFSRKLIESQENERKRIAAEIHDSLGQNLLVVKNRALLALEKSGLPGEVRDDLTEISNTASGTLKDVRELSRRLRPYELDRFGITEALKSVIEKVSDASTITMSTEIDPIDGLLTKEGEINLYRIVQECLNNIVKHSHAKEAAVVIARESGQLVVTVRDNGKGFDAKFAMDPDAREHGLGLESTAERVRILNGQYTIQSSLGSGTTVRIVFPILSKHGFS